MTLLRSIAVRTIALVLAVAVYAVIGTQVWDERGDANIGAGLIGFALVLAISFGWALADAMRLGAGYAVGAWLGVAVAAVLVVLALVLLPGDGSMTTSERLVDTLGLAPMVAGLVAGPALVAAAVGGALRSIGGERPEVPEHHG